MVVASLLIVFSTTFLAVATPYHLSCTFCTAVFATVGEDPPQTPTLEELQQPFVPGVNSFIAPNFIETRKMNQENQEPLPGWLVVTGRAGGIVTGAWAAALTHELGHAMVAWGYGYRFLWPTTGRPSDPFLPLWEVRPDLTDRPNDRRNIALGGFVMSEIVTESLLSAPFPKSDTFVGGFVFYDIINSLMYVVRDVYESSQGNRGVGDIRDIHDGGIPREVVYGVLLTKAAVNLARLLESPEFLRLSFWSSSTEERK